MILKIEFFKKITQSEQQKERQMKRKKSKATYEISRIYSVFQHPQYMVSSRRREKGVENVFEHIIQNSQTKRMKQISGIGNIEAPKQEELK